MIINLNLRGKTVVVIGGGGQAERRISSLLDEHCRRIVVLAGTATGAIKGWAQERKIELVPGRIHDASFLSDYLPHVVIAATDDHSANGMALAAAKEAGILAYASDNPDESDFAHAAVIDLDGAKAAVFTGGQSPIMARRIRDRAARALLGIVTPQDRQSMRVQSLARTAAKEIIGSQSERRERLHKIMTDSTIDRLISDGRQAEAERRAMSMLRETAG